jgi:hypothetical protein
MSRTRVAGIAAAMLAVGLIVGMAGTAIAHEGATAADCARVMAEHMDGQSMADHMNGQAMGDMSSMMGGGGSMMGPGAAGMPGSLHQLHHPQATPGTTP